MWSLSLFLLLLTSSVFSNELSRCCSGGSRHFKQTATCSNIRSEGTGLTCVRAASICCLRSLLDDACEEGAKIAREEETCLANINVLGGGLKKECCDCCLLAKDLLHRNEPCVPPTGFSAACLKSFSKCCNDALELTPAHLHITGRPESDSNPKSGDRCARAKCDHLCNDRGGDSVECTCRPGFELAPDGTSCVDKNECKSTTPPCEWGKENCVNTIGGYICQPLNPANVRIISAESQSRFVRMRSGRKPKSQELRLRDAPAKKDTSKWSCNEGYEYRDGLCRDVDECNLGAHDCGPLYQCRNTQGSYRCDPKTCGEGELQNPSTGECTSIDCPMGYFPKNGMCNDIDECADNSRCGSTEQCVNTPGSFRCQDMGNLCSEGYYTNKNTGFCEDVDECQTGACGSLECLNLPGSYRCKCVSGYEFNEKTKRCEDIDECVKFGGHVCDPSATCQNTVGSFVCKCKEGYKLASDQRHCEDVNECATGVARCEQKCVNIPGSYQCICDRGFALGSNGLTCEDIDECSIWAGSGSDLCMGGCVNTRGSYLCQCPPGYKIQADGRTCVDVDECSLGECQGQDRICVNTLGQFKCHRIQCPHNYVLDSKYKNRCNRMRSVCDGMSASACMTKHPVHYTWQYIALPKAVPISSHRPSITLFTIRGPAAMDSDVQFELQLKNSTHESLSVIRAIRPNFLLQKGAHRNSAVIALRDSLDGPQTVELELILRLTKNNIFAGKYVANLVVHVSSHKRHTNFVPL